MKTNILIIVAIFFTFISCSDDNDDNTPSLTTNNVLVLKVDYTTNTFEGGKELSFAIDTTDFTITYEYTPPGDFGNITMTYQELNETLFDGSIVWAGLGQMNYPQNLLGANQFDYVLTADYALAPGFENVFNLDNTVYDYEPVWSSVQGLVKVRQYLASNPYATVKLFLYTPSVGVGDPEEWDWIIFMKN